MAIQTKTITGSTSSPQWTWKMEIIENSYSIENNNSSVTVNSYLGRASSQSYFGGSANVNITCNGTSRNTSKTFSYPTYVNGGGWVLVQSETFTISHNDDGKKTITVSSSLSTGDFNPNSASASGSMTLSTIPRASSVSVSNYDLGQNIGIVIGKKVSSFTSTLKYEIGSLNGTIVTKTTDSNYIWTMTEELINQIKTNYPNTNKVSAKILCDTYNGNSKIGSTQSATFTLTIVDIPTIENIVIEEQNTMVSGLTTDIVKYVSKSKITVNATAPYGTTIKKYYFLKGGNNYNSSSNEYTLSNIQDFFTSGNVLKTRFTVYVEDNRGNVSLETIEDRNFIDYVNLAINTTDIKLARTSNVSNTVKLSLTGFVYNGLIGSSQNTVSVKYRYKLQESSVWSSFVTIPAIIENNTFKISNLQLAGSFDYRENYDFEFYATDLLQTTPASTFLLSSTEYVYLFHKNGADFKTLTEGKKRVALKEDVEKNLLQIGISSNYNYSSGNVVTLPFSQTTQQIGNLFTLVGNKIVVGGNNVSGKCRVVCNLFGFYPSGVVNYCYAYLYKNGIETADVFSAGSGSSSRFSLLMDVILDYHSGDEFELKIGGDNNFQLLASYYRSIMYIQSITNKGE